QAREELALRRWSERHGSGNEHGALALAQVVACGFSRHARVTEDAEHVVSQLERLAERQAELARGRERGLVGAREGCAERDGMLDRVTGRLRPDHLASPRL